MQLTARLPGDFWEVLAAAEVDAGCGGAQRSLAGGLEHPELSPNHGRRLGADRVARPANPWRIQYCVRCTQGFGPLVRAYGATVQVPPPS